MRSGRQLRALVEPPKPPRRVNVERQQEERARANGDESYKRWLHDQPCAVCGWEGATQECHAKGGGAGRKADARFTFPGCTRHMTVTSAVERGGFLVPRLGMTEGCHHVLHRMGVKTFERLRGVNLLALAEQTQARYAAWLRSAGAAHPED